MNKWFDHNEQFTPYLSNTNVIRRCAPSPLSSAQNRSILKARKNFAIIPIEALKRNLFLVWTQLSCYQSSQSVFTAIAVKLENCSPDTRTPKKSSAFSISLNFRREMCNKFNKTSLKLDLNLTTDMFASFQELFS